ncbi:MAG TPA: transglutaminase domain-containing protein [Cyclobacteriaceae bacterium]|nr:transglutaminase domain-containing protein [Cyclobacteriaceae bacterium]
MLIVIVVLVGAFLYIGNPDIRARIDRWIGINQADSLQQKSGSDKILSKSNPKKKAPKKNEKIPKAIKPDKYALIDKYARETPDKYSHDKVILAKYLQKPAKNDIEKARLIYTWIATHIQYDDEAFNTGKEKNESAASVLARRTTNSDGFSNLFLELGLLMKLQVQKVSGHTKGYGFQKGEKFSSNHDWNAVKIGRTWQLIDVTWGGSYAETTDKGLKSTMQFDPYWFCVRPDAFIFSHLPENNSWQLAGEVISPKQYGDLPSLKESFFKMGFDARNVFRKAISGETKEFVETFDLDYPVNGAALPITKKILRGTEYNFLLESEYLENVILIDDGQQVELKREGNSYQMKYIPRGEKLQIAVKVNSFDTKFSIIAVYDIVDGGT